jgi:beta propeller repeat protein
MAVFMAVCICSAAQTANQRLIQITCDAVEQTYADIWEHTIVYLQNDSSCNNVYAYFIDTGEKLQLTGLTHYPCCVSYYPAIHQDKIVFPAVSDPNENVDIWLYDLSGGTVRLTREPHVQLYPRIWDRYVVWQDWRNMPESPFDPANHDIFALDLLTGVEISVCTNPADELWPDIWENYIVYQSYRSGVKNDIFLYDINTGIERKITDANDYDAWEPKINDGKVVWFGGPDQNHACITVHDIVSGQRWSTPLQNYNEFDPRISGDRVVWRSGIYWDVLPYWVQRQWNINSSEISDIGWFGQCLSQEGANIYKGLTVFCQLDGTQEEQDSWDVWLACNPSDLNIDGEVNLEDFAIFAESWLE